MSPRYPSKEAGELVRWAKRFGWRWAGYYGNGHLRMKHRSGAEYALAATPSDSKSQRNAKAAMHRLAGTKARERKPNAGHYSKGPATRPGRLPTGSPPGSPWLNALDEIENIDGMLSVLDPVRNRAQAEQLAARRIHYAAVLRRYAQPVPPPPELDH